MSHHTYTQPGRVPFVFLVLPFLPIASCLLNKMRTHLNLRMRTQIWQRERGVPFASEGFKFFNAGSERTCVLYPALQQQRFTLHDHDDDVVNRPLVQEAPISKKKTAAKFTHHPADDNGSLVSIYSCLVSAATHIKKYINHHSPCQLHPSQEHL